MKSMFLLPKPNRKTAFLSLHKMNYGTPRLARTAIHGIAVATTRLQLLSYDFTTICDEHEIMAAWPWIPGRPAVMKSSPDRDLATTTNVHGLAESLSLRWPRVRPWFVWDCNDRMKKRILKMSTYLSKEYFLKASDFGKLQMNADNLKVTICKLIIALLGFVLISESWHWHVGGPANSLTHLQTQCLPEKLTLHASSCIEHADRVERVLSLWFMATVLSPTRTGEEKKKKKRLLKK